MENLIKLAKLVNIKYHKDAIKRIEYLECYRGKCEVNATEDKMSVFSKEKLIDDKYYYIKRCTPIDGDLPIYKVEKIDIYEIDKLIEQVIRKGFKKLEFMSDSYECKSYRTRLNEYIYIIDYIVCGTKYSESSKGMSHNMTIIESLYKSINKIKKLFDEFSKRTNKVKS